MLAPRTLRHAQLAIVTLLMLAAHGQSQVTQPLPHLPAVSAPSPQWRVEGWAVPFGAPSGEVGVAADGAVWFCQPTLVSLTRFDPLTEGFTLHNPGFIGPQGMTVDPTGKMWLALTTGGPAGGKLDEFDPAAGTDVHHPLPYAGALPTKVLVSSTGTIWVLDSWNGRVSEYSPSTGTWLQSLSIPVAGAWPTSFAEDPHTHTIYATCYQIDKLAIFAPGQPPVLVSTPPLRPSSCAWSNGLLYYVLDSQPKLLTYNPATGQHTAYTYGESWDPAATVLALPDGRVVVSTHNGNGNLHFFHPAGHFFVKYQFPPGLGGNIGSRMTLSPSGDLWLTKSPSTGPSLLVRLHLP